MKNIEISIAWLDNKGATRQAKRIYKGPLPGGKADQLRLNIKMSDARDLSNRVRVEVTAAQLAE
jgi:hypothetical protein